MNEARFAHEFYPHPDVDDYARPLSEEVPYLYARAIGFEIEGTRWDEADREMRAVRIELMLDARRTALLADALFQGLVGDEAWAWAWDHREDDCGFIFERARAYGVPVTEIRPYPCGPERARSTIGDGDDGAV